MITDAKKAMKNLWDKWKASHPHNEVNLPITIDTRQAREGDSEDEFEIYMLERKKVAAKTAKEGDEYAAYISTGPLENRPADLYKWWSDRCTDWPILSRLALIILSILGMSAKCERVFSQGKRLL